MTYAEALKALTPPLVFWGEEQLAAVKFLEEVEEVVELLREEPEAHRCKFAYPERERRVVAPDKTMALRRNRAAVHCIVHPVNRPAGNALAKTNRPLDSVAPAVPRQKRGMIGERAEPGLRPDRRPDIAVEMRGDD